MNRCEYKHCPRPKQSGRFCYRCTHRRYKKNHPFRYFYNLAKSNARRRNITWALSFEEYRTIWLEHPRAWKEKIESNGLNTWTMDRIYSDKPYEVENIQIIKLRANVRKYYLGDKFIVDKEWRIEYALSDIEAPF